MDPVALGVEYLKSTDPQVLVFVTAALGALILFAIWRCLGKQDLSKVHAGDVKAKESTKSKPAVPKDAQTDKKSSTKTETKVVPAPTQIVATNDHPLFQVRLKGFKDAINCAVFSPDGRYLAVCDNERIVRVYFVETLKERDHRNIQVNMQYDNAIACDFSASGNDLIVAMADQQRIAAYQIMEKKGKDNKHYALKAEFQKGHKFPLKDVKLAPSAAYIVSISTETEVLVWNLQGAVIERIDTKQMKNFCVAVSPNSRFFAVGCFTADVKIWEVGYDKKTNMFAGVKKQHVMDLKGHKRGVNSISFSPDATRVATASQDCTWKMWRIDVRYEMQEDPKILYSVENPINPTIPFTVVSISPDGTTVAAATANHVLFWKAADGTLLGTVENAHSKAVSSLSWSRGSDLVASGAHDMTVALWKNPNKL